MGIRFMPTGSVVVAGKIRAVPKSFEDASRLMRYVFTKSIQDSAYGEWVQGEYSRLYPKSNRSVDYNVLDQY